MRAVLISCLALILGACGSNPSREGDSRKPANINAELGLSYMQNGNYDLALVKLKKALEENPDLPQAHHYLAELYRRTGNDEGALEAYHDAIRLAPKDPVVHGNYAIYRCDRGDYEIAEEAFEETIDLYRDRRRFGVHEQAAACAIKAKNDALAERHLRSALEGNPKSAFALFQMARLMYRETHYLQARAFMQRLDATHQGSVETLELGRDIEQALGDAEGVESYRRKLTALGAKADQKGSN
ncbi:MAG: type IV pilus biogenesis/stability protein PilW [Gammaproteobacteria bacterium]|nr:type IV pilus biogenesis/stability protein PilW [Gammaproteobacteria bacterium]